MRAATLPLIALPLAFLPVISACSEGAAGSGAVTRDTLPDGTVRVRYAALPTAEAPLLAPELSIGALEGEPHEVFGDVRGVDAGPDGTIYVLDNQSSEVRAYRPDGSFRGLVTSRGEGPGEITQANGLVVDGDGTIWVYDHGKLVNLGLDAEGNEVARVPTPVRSWGYIWNGVLADDGHFWKPAAHPVGDRSREPGLQESTSRLYMKSIDPATERYDSVFVGTATTRTWIADMGGGRTSFGSIPFDATSLLAMDPAGGFWIGHGGSYRVVRLDERGDTTLVLEADLQPRPVTADDRRAHLDALGDDSPHRASTREAMEHSPDIHPVLDQLFVDEEGRLWVRHAVSTEEAVPWDVFHRDGTHAGSVSLPADTHRYLPPRVRNGRLYTVTTDSLGVPRVVRMELPPNLAAADG